MLRETRMYQMPDYFPLYVVAGLVGGGLLHYYEYRVYYQRRREAHQLQKLRRACPYRPRGLAVGRKSLAAREHCLICQLEKTTHA